MWTIVIGSCGDCDCAWPEQMLLRFGIHTVPRGVIEEKQLL